MLDLFAGSGALGLEALSRGADSVDFVENARRELGRDSGQRRRRSAPAPAARVHRADALRFVDALDAHAYDVAFADPPYDLGLATALAERWLAKPFATSSASSIAPTKRCPATETDGATAARRSPSFAPNVRATDAGGAG